jgi:hypothetical protein
MAQRYRKGHKLDVWLSDRAWADLALLPEVTRRARVEAALALAVTASAAELPSLAEQAQDCTRSDGIKALRILADRAAQENWNVRTTR